MAITRAAIKSIRKRRRAACRAISRYDAHAETRVKKKQCNPCSLIRPANGSMTFDLDALTYYPANPSCHDAEGEVEIENKKEHHTKSGKYVEGTRGSTLRANAAVRREEGKSKVGSCTVNSADIEQFWLRVGSLADTEMEFIPVYVSGKPRVR